MSIEDHFINNCNRIGIKITPKELIEISSIPNSNKIIDLIDQHFLIDSLDQKQNSLDNTSLINQTCLFKKLNLQINNDLFKYKELLEGEKTKRFDKLIKQLNYEIELPNQNTSSIHQLNNNNLFKNEIERIKIETEQLMAISNFKFIEEFKQDYLIIRREIKNNSSTIDIEPLILYLNTIYNRISFFNSFLLLLFYQEFKIKKDQLQYENEIKRELKEEIDLVIDKFDRLINQFKKKKPEEERILNEPHQLHKCLVEEELKNQNINLNIKTEFIIDELSRVTVYFHFYF